MCVKTDMALIVYDVQTLCNVPIEEGIRHLHLRSSVGLHYWLQFDTSARLSLGSSGFKI